MEQTSKKHEKTFLEWYNSLDVLSKRSFRLKLINASGMQAPTFYSKVQRNCSFTPLEQKAIQDIVGENIIIIFPVQKVLNP